MNPNTPPTSDDDLPDERELAALYARLPKAESDPALDAAVLAAAAHALPIRRRPRWPVALGSAAVLLLAVGVAWQLRDTRPETAASLPVSPEPVATPAPAPAPPPDVAASPKPQVLAKPAPAKSARSSHLSQTLRAPAAPPSPPPPPSPVAPPAPPVPEAAMPAPMAAPPAAELAEPSPAVDAASNARFLPKLDLGPDDRVGEIRRLLDRGQRDEARRRLRELRERYPRYELPQDLRDLTP